jgi:hypothetical protein
MLATAESWLGRPLASSSQPDEMIRRYLRAFGPASVADMQAWSCVAGLREPVEQLRPTLVSMRVMPHLGRPFILIDGFVDGFWKIRSDRVTLASASWQTLRRCLPRCPRARSCRRSAS